MRDGLGIKLLWRSICSRARPTNLLDLLLGVITGDVESRSWSLVRVEVVALLAFDAARSKAVSVLSRLVSSGDVVRLFLLSSEDGVRVVDL